MTHLDDDALDRGIARRSLTAAEHNVLVDTRQFMQRGDFAAARGSRTLAMEVLAAGAVAVLVIGVILVLARPASPRPQPAVTHPTASPTGTPTVTASPSPSAVPVGATPPILEQVRLGNWWVNALTVEPGVVWAAVQSPNYGEPGRLIRIDTSTARQTASWVIGGDPIAVAAAGPYVWVANSFGDSSKVLPEQNTVEQFNAATGRLMHVYRVTDPRGLVANPTSALVVWESTDSRAQLSLLSGGGNTTIAGVPGTVLGPGVSSQSAIVVCGDEVFFAASMTGTGEMDATIYAVRPSGGAVRTIATIPGDFEPDIACDGTALFVNNGTNGGIVRVSLADGTVGPAWPGSYPFAMTYAGGRLWVMYLSNDAQDEPFLTSLDPATGVAARSGFSPPATTGLFDRYLIVPGTTGLWVVAGDGNVLLNVRLG